MSDRPRFPRSNCIVPFCRRWSTRFPGDWICCEHWRLVDRALKVRWNKHKRARGLVWEKISGQRRAAQAALATGGRELDVWRLVDRERRAEVRWRRCNDLFWRKVKRQAIERAGGIA